MEKCRYKSLEELPAILCAEFEDLYEDKIQILCLQYALQLLWVAEVVWIEDVRLNRSRVQEEWLDEQTSIDD